MAPRITKIWRKKTPSRGDIGCKSYGHSSFHKFKELNTNEKNVIWMFHDKVFFGIVLPFSLETDPLVVVAVVILVAAVNFWYYRAPSFERPLCY